MAATSRGRARGRARTPGACAPPGAGTACLPLPTLWQAAPICVEREGEGIEIKDDLVRLRHHFHGVDNGGDVEPDQQDHAYQVADVVEEKVEGGQGQS